MNGNHIYDLKIQVEHSGRIIPVDKILNNVTVKDLIENLATKIEFPSTKGILIRKSTMRQLLPEQTLKDTGIEDGETLLADFERVAGLTQ